MQDCTIQPIIDVNHDDHVLFQYFYYSGTACFSVLLTLLRNKNLGG